jgi:hypothetical protein
MARLIELPEDQISNDQSYPVHGLMLKEWIVEAKLAARREEGLKKVVETLTNEIRGLKGAGTGKAA